MNAADTLLFKNPNMRRLWLGQVASQAGTRMFQIAVTWWLLTQAAQGGGIRLAVFLVFCSLPGILFVKQIGAWVDSRPTKNLLIAADGAAFAVTLLLIPLAHGSTALPSLMGAGFLLSFFQCLVDPGLNKAIPQIVSPAETEAAVSLVSTTQSIANFGGAVFGAFAIGWFGLKGAILVNAASYLVSVIAVSGTRFRKQEAPIEVPSETPARMRPEPPFLRQILLGFGFVNFFATPTLIVLPVYTKTVLHGDSGTLGLLEASLWLGMLLGAFFSERIRVSKNTLQLGGACLFAFGLFLALPGVFTAFWIYFLCLFSAGFALSVNNIKFITLFQSVVPDAVKGRFFAKLTALVNITFPVAFLFFGFFVDRVPVTTLCALQGVGVAAIALWFWAVSKKEVELWA